MSDNLSNVNGILIGTCTGDPVACVPDVPTTTVSPQTTTINIYCVDPFTGISVPGGCTFDGRNFGTSGVNIQGDYQNVVLVTVSGIKFRVRPPGRALANDGRGSVRLAVRQLSLTHSPASVAST
jgi:hypothetical protein